MIIAVELIEKEELSSEFINQKITDLESILASDNSNTKVQTKLDSLRSLGL